MTSVSVNTLGLREPCSRTQAAEEALASQRLLREYGTAVGRFMLVGTSQN